MRRRAGRVRAAATVAALALALSSAPAAYAQAAKPASARERYQAGVELLESGSVYRAVDAFMAAVAANPAYADAWAMLARCQYELGEYERAVSFIAEAYKYGPRSPSLITLEAFSRIGQGSLAEARALLEEALARLPNDRDARFGMALLDLRNGRPGDARARLSSSLKTAPRDPRALLSLALISRAEGRVDEASAYLAEALRWTAGDPDASYAAAELYYERGDLAEAARLAGQAVRERPGHAGARRLLAQLYYERGALDEARDVLDGSIALDRADARAWFLLGLVEKAAGRRAEAEYALSTLAALRPEDELARIALENLVIEGTGFEDPSRPALAAWRFARAAEFERRLLYQKAVAEYRRGLLVDPYANPGRRRYAELLRGSGLPSSYLAELRFLDDLGKSDRALADAIEIYDSLLAGSVGRDWNVGLGARTDPYRLAVFSVAPDASTYHAGGDLVVARYLRDSLAFEPGLAPDRGVARVEGFADAFALARESGAEWFVLVRVAETERDVLVSAELRAARTGALAARVDAPRSGNDRVALSVARVVQGIRAALPTRGSLLERRGDLALVGLGRVDGVAVGDAFIIVKSGAVSIEPDGSGLAWKDADVVARVVASRVDDELFEGKLERVGFFDRVNPRDVALREPPKPEDAQAAGADASAAKASSPSSSPEAVQSSYLWSALFERVRSLY
ncbi:MAG TPA: tetratricopeptide repeat protein [Spirochaetia bacterium]|nr:tetratricopeptide repeat protein [Spirochaetia bacterium]